MKYIAFRKGIILDETILENIMFAASRGKMTPEGEKLLLVPDTRHGRVDETGLKNMKSVKNWDCRTLAQKYGKAKSLKAAKVGL